MSEGKLLLAWFNGLLHGKNSVESHAQAGVLLRSQDSTLVREQSEESFAPGHRESPALTGPTITQPFTPFYYDCCLEYLAHVSQAAAGSSGYFVLVARLVW